jgi:hypothetical protein
MTGEGGAADRSVHGRMGLGRVCKEETLRIKNVVIDSSGVRKLCLWVEESCLPTEKFTHTHIYLYI